MNALFAHPPHRASVRGVKGAFFHDRFPGPAFDGYWKLEERDQVTTFRCRIADAALPLLETAPTPVTHMTLETGLTLRVLTLYAGPIPGEAGYRLVGGQHLAMPERTKFHPARTRHFPP